MIIHKDIFNFYILKQLDFYMKGHKGFIAGGCFKNIFNGEKIKDIDIFFQNEKDWFDAICYYDSMTKGYNRDDKRDEIYRFYYENERVKAYKNLQNGIVVELCNSVYGKPADVISNFDFTICKFAYYKNIEIVEDEFEEGEFRESIVYKVCMNNNFFEHLHLKRLVVDDQLLFPDSTFERMIRYIGYGFKPCRETKMKMMLGINNMNEEDIRVGKGLYVGLD